jgi:hypothetical protein
MWCLVWEGTELAGLESERVGQEVLRTLACGLQGVWFISVLSPRMGTLHGRLGLL